VTSAQGRGQPKYVRAVLGVEYARCQNLVANCDREIDKCKRSLEEWETERQKWAGRLAVLREELGDEPVVPPRKQSELTDAWEFDFDA
jgi:chromosome segregation ATPase